MLTNKRTHYVEDHYRFMQICRQYRVMLKLIFENPLEYTVVDSDNGQNSNYIKLL